MQLAAAAALVTTKAASPSRKLPLLQRSELLPRSVAGPLPPWRGGGQTRRKTLLSDRPCMLAWLLASKCVAAQEHGDGL